MKYFSWLIRKAAIILAAALLCQGAVLAADSTLTGLNDKYTKLEKQLKDNQKKIDQTKNSRTAQKAIQTRTSQQLEILEGQASVLQERINYLENQVIEQEQRLDELEADVLEKKELLKKRIRALYMTDTSTTLGLILGSDSFSDFLTRGENLKRITAHDQELIQELNTKLEEINLTRTELSGNRSDLAASKKTFAGKQEELNKQLKEAEAQIEDLDRLEREFLANQATIKKQEQEVQAEIDAIYEQMKKAQANQPPVQDYSGSGFAWPLPGYQYISSYYGWRFNGTDYHTGIDITGSNVYGKPVVASNSGTISYAQTTYVQGRGYGKYIIINHGGNFSTLYGHMSNLNTSMGAVVQKGQTIGFVGSTGWSTGPHLHFEIRVNGKHTNPLTYLKR